MIGMIETVTDMIDVIVMTGVAEMTSIHDGEFYRLIAGG